MLNGGAHAQSTQREQEENVAVDVEDERLLTKMRRLLRPTIKNVGESLRQLDTNKSGYVTNIQFRNAIKQRMGLALTQTEIDILLNIAQLDGRVNIAQFLKLIQFT